MLKASTGIATSAPPLRKVFADINWPGKVKMSNSMDCHSLAPASAFDRGVVKIILVFIYGDNSGTFVEVDNYFDLNLGYNFLTDVHKTC